MLALRDELNAGIICDNLLAMFRRKTAKKQKKIIKNAFNIVKNLFSSSPNENKIESVIHFHASKS